MMRLLSAYMCRSKGKNQQMQEETKKNVAVMPYVHKVSHKAKEIAGGMESMLCFPLHAGCLKYA